MNNVLIYAGGVLSLLNLLYFAWNIWDGIVPPTNTASWLMWTLLDATALVTTIAARKPFALVLSYVIGAVAVLFVHIQIGTWIWTNVETFSVIGVVVSVILWQKLSPEFGIIACISAMSIAGIPLLVMLWNQPNPGAFWVFANTAIACTLTLAGTRSWTIGGALLPTSGLVFNTAVALIALR